MSYTFFFLHNFPRLYRKQKHKNVRIKITSKLIELPVILQKLGMLPLIISSILQAIWKSLMGTFLKKLTSIVYLLTLMCWIIHLAISSLVIPIIHLLTACCPRTAITHAAFIQWKRCPTALVTDLKNACSRIYPWWIFKVCVFLLLLGWIISIATWNKFCSIYTAKLFRLKYFFGRNICMPCWSSYCVCESQFEELNVYERGY